MQIVRNKETKVVYYIFQESESITLTENGMKVNETTALDITSGTHEILKSIPSPEYFLGGALIWDAEWQIADQAAVNAYTERKVQELTDAKLSKKQEINAARLEDNFSTFVHNEKVIACDQLSRSDIDGVNGYVGINGTLPPDFPGAWKAKDDSYLLIPSVEAWKDFYLSMYNAGLSHFMKSQQLKAQVDACTTLEQLSAIKW